MQRPICAQLALVEELNLQTTALATSPQYILRALQRDGLPGFEAAMRTHAKELEEMVSRVGALTSGLDTNRAGARPRRKAA